MFHKNKKPVVSSGRGLGIVLAEEPPRSIYSISVALDQSLIETPSDVAYDLTDSLSEQELV